MTEIPTPSKEEVYKYIKKWETLENYVNQENSLKKLFVDLIPENKLLEDILIKVSTLNDFYSTNIFSVFLTFPGHSIKIQFIALAFSIAVLSY